MENKINLDSAATTYVNQEVINEMLPIFTDYYGNANSIHSLGQEANKMLQIARTRIAKSINAKANEIYFTSGGTEANNWAIYGLAHANKERGRHIIVSQIEHDSVLNTCKLLEKQGFEITYLPVDKYGFVKLDSLMHNLRKDTILVSIMTANNEVGTIQHLQAISKTVKEKNAIFHTDAVAAFGNISIDVNQLGIDCMTISGHKIYAPKGIGALYIKDGVLIDNLILGGSQERGKRSGTVNVPYAVAFGKACEISVRDSSVYNQKIKNLRNYFISKLMEEIPNIELNGHPMQKLNNIINLKFEGVDASALAILLDLDGIFASVGPACTAGDVKPSHVLKAMGLSDADAKSSIRFSLPRNITKEELNYAIGSIVKNVSRLREMSPIKLKKKKEEII